MQLSGHRRRLFPELQATMFGNIVLGWNLRPHLSLLVLAVAILTDLAAQDTTFQINAKLVNVVGKYPPAKPEALWCEPLKAA
jgi:hypothetical protein